MLKTAHGAADGRVGEATTDHEKLSGRMKLLPPSAMRFEVKRKLGAEVDSGLVEQHVLYPRQPTVPRPRERIEQARSLS